MDDREAAKRLYAGREFYVKGEEGPNHNIRYALPQNGEALDYRFVEIVDGKITRALTEDEVEVREVAQQQTAGGPKTVPIMKRFHRSDSLVYEYNMIELHDRAGWVPGNDPTIMRHCVRLQASPGASWRSIAKIVNTLRTQLDNHENGNPALLCCMVETNDFCVALTLKGFLKVCEGLSMYGRIPFNELVDNLARELVAIRDYEEYMNADHLEGIDRRDMKFNDFWPKS